MKSTTKSATEPSTDGMLQRFKDALQIVKTGKGKDGMAYNSLGTLNQAAWIGENSGLLIREIERLRDNLNASIITAAEFGFRCHEKGMNIEAMLQEAAKP